MQYNVVMNIMHHHRHDRAPLSLYKRSTNTQSSILDHKNSGPKISSKQRFNAHPVLRPCMRKGGGGCPVSIPLCTLPLYVFVTFSSDLSSSVQPPPPLHSSTAVSKHGVGVEPLF